MAQTFFAISSIPLLHAEVTIIIEFCRHTTLTTADLPEVVIRDGKSKHLGITPASWAFFEGFHCLSCCFVIVFSIANRFQGLFSTIGGRQLNHSCLASGCKVKDMPLGAGFAMVGVAKAIPPRKMALSDSVCKVRPSQRLKSA